MFSKSQFKIITNLARKKYRTKHQLFLVEGKKGISEFLDSHFQLHSLYTTENVFKAEKDKTYFLEEEDLKKISQLSTPQTALAVFHIPAPVDPVLEGFTLALDGIRDPGNLGTIIRLCDWFGIKQLLCSLDTVDCYNPKVVQASMGSLARVNVSYIDLPDFLKKTQKEVKVYGAFMEGENVYRETLKPEGILVMGNEANGIRAEIEDLVNERISIPQLGPQKTESLNVSTATAILLSEFFRNSY